MIKLDDLERVLKVNPQVGLVHKAKDVTFPGSRGISEEQTVEYHVAPKRRLFKVKSMQKFMNDLITITNGVVSLHHMRSFSEDKDHINFGYLAVGEYNPSDRTYRHITISPFPSESYLSDVLKGKRSKHLHEKGFLRRFLEEGPLEEADSVIDLTDDYSFYK